LKRKDNNVRRTTEERMKNGGGVKFTNTP